jgi:hypothetical protein
MHTDKKNKKNPQISRITQIKLKIKLLCRKLLINTRLRPGAQGVAGKKPFERFFWGRSWFTALKRGVNEMISTEQDKICENLCDLRIKCFHLCFIRG